MHFDFGEVCVWDTPLDFFLVVCITVLLNPFPVSDQMYTHFQAWGLFLKSPGNLPGPITKFLKNFLPIIQWLQTWYLANVFYRIIRF